MKTANHLRECEDCRQIVAAVAYVDRDERRGESAPKWRVSRPWWLGLAAAAFLAGIAILYFWRPWISRDPVAVLIAAQPAEARFLEPRLSGGFPWAPIRANRRNGVAEPLDPGQMKLIGAAGEVLQRTAGDSSTAARHAAALAHLLASRPSEAATRLDSLAKNEGSASILNDLAAARYALAVQDDDPAQLARALAAADAALRVQPDSAEASFNRALIIDRLGLRPQATAAWRRYLQLDSGSKWAQEARQHLQRLAPQTEFRMELERDYALLTRKDGAARALASRFPQEARVWGESEILARWAQCVRANDTAEAAGHLRLAHSFGEELAHRSGERMLQSVVRVVEGADGSDVATLVDAHLAFRDAQRMYRQNRPVEAEAAFNAAAAGFERAGSPAAVLARYFAANTIYEQGRIAEARERLRALLATSAPQFAAHRAQLRWQLALTDASLGQWGAAIRSLDESVRIFERLGERRYATSVREILAEVYDRIGDRETAWTHRLIALQELGRSDSPRLQLAVGSIARAAALDRDWQVALAFLGLELEIARHNGNDVVTVETLLLRARVHDRVGRRGAARSDLADATRMISRLRDRALRDRAEAERLAVAGMLTASPVETVKLLTQAIEFHGLRGRRMFLPEMHLQRGRAFAVQGDSGKADRDFEAGIRELEAQRTSIEAGEARWGVISRGEELFDEAVALAVDRGDTQRAFAYSERGRARDLLESIERRHAAPPVETGAILIEYSTLPTRLIIFVVGDGNVRTVQERIARPVLADLVDRLGRSIVAGDDAEFRRIASTLYDRLVAPVAAELPPGRPLVFIPDGVVDAVPFAALLDPQDRYLIERHAVTVAPSAAVFHRLAALRAHLPGGEGLLLIAGPPVGEGSVDALTAAQREVDAITAIYGPETVLAPKSSDYAALATRASVARVIHFVGHVGPGQTRRSAAILASRLEGDAGLLDVREIASMDLGRARIVVLAACSSARGENLPREGSISVARAFLAAGVPSVVATLWPIDDAAAAEFFPRLHQQLAAGLSPAEALRETQLDCLRHGVVPLSMWAAVQVHGS
jgi:CHAT domain-containing protein